MHNKFTYFFVATIAILFGYWFAKMQLQVIASDALLSYPASFLILTLVKCCLTIAVFFAASQMLLSYLSDGKISSVQTAFMYIPLLLVYLNVPMYWIAFLILALHVFCFVYVTDKANNRRLRDLYSIDLAVLLLLFVLHLFLTSALSPLHWNMALLTMDGFNGEEVPVVVPLFKGFVLAKQYSFANIDHSQWAGMMHPAVSMASPFIQLVAFILDIPSVSYEAFHVLVMTTYFILMVLGSFGFYLFLKYAVKVHFMFSVLGGILFYFSGAPLLHLSFHSDAGIFLSAQSCFPFALLFISLAFEDRSLRYAALAGLSMAAQFFFFSPHPEATIYLFLFYGVYAFGMFLFSQQLPWGERFRLVTISFLTFFALSAYYLTPIMADRLTGNMYAFAHVRDISFTYMKYFNPYIRLVLIFAPISFGLLYYYRKISAVYLSSLLLAIILGIFVSLTTHQSFNIALVHFLNLGLHVWVPTRPGVYFYVSSFIIAMIGLDILTHAIRDVIEKKYLPFLGK